MISSAILNFKLVSLKREREKKRMNKLWSLKGNIKKIVQNNIEPPK